MISPTELVFVEKSTDMDEAILKLARDGDVVVTMGAGSVGGVPARLIERAKSIQEKKE